ncbi:MAG: nucleotidyl transferase AbiEii/AbiGii toxin family protein [Elusimicrobia bacterium]|nr:nucleotidyl transferase AbiEii/AbiGii toxin family protein [Elusimicrobiota bacterium]
MYRSVLASGVPVLLKKLKEMIVDGRFVLAGGTALALQLGHRTSEDLDFFTRHTFSTEKTFQKLKRLRLELKIVQEENQTLSVLIQDVKVSLFNYPYPFTGIQPKFLGVPLANVLDIASMKIIAACQRGTKRDFVDLYFILQDIPFRKVAENMIERYGKERINPIVVGKSLVYFNDADGDPEPSYIVKNRPSWENIKTFFKNNIQQIVLDIQNAIND